MHPMLKRELRRWRNYESRFALANIFPTNRVKYVCDDLPETWSCEEKAAKCKKILQVIGSRTLIMDMEWKSSYNVSLLSFKSELLTVCITSFGNFQGDFEDDKVLCVGPDKMFQVGLIYCRKFLECLDRTMNILTTYGRNMEKCQGTAKSLTKDISTWPLEYGIREKRWSKKKVEYIKVRLASMESQVPRHFLSQCSLKQPFLYLSNSPEDVDVKENEIICQRETIKIVTAHDVFPSCHKFIDACLEMIRCLHGLERCFSSQFGLETKSGFLVNNVTEWNQLIRIDLCEHWAVELQYDNHGKLFCHAKRYFQLNQLNFCESYSWSCTKLIQCVNVREKCLYFPNKKQNFSTQELPEYGIVNIQMPEFFTNDNPRKYVPDLFKCNKKYGYRHQVYLYFITTSCHRQYGGCNLNMSTYDNERSFQEAAQNIVDMVAFNSLGSIANTYETDPEELVYVWLCKRETLSTVNCSEFLRICDEVRSCMVEREEDTSISLDLPPSETCFSPLPVNTIFSKPTISGGKRHNPVALAPGLNYVLPLEKTYPRIFRRIFNWGWEAKTGNEVRSRRKNLFFNLFLEDCRHRHQFEGFLTEPYLTETVNYLICSVPFGIPRQRENPLVAAGCSHIQKTCEKMKRCYIHHAEYFTFHSFINDNVFVLAIIMVVIFFPSLFLTIVTNHLDKITISGMDNGT